MTVAELLVELAKLPTDLDVVINGYCARDDDERHNTAFDLVAVEGWQDGDGRRRVVLWGRDQG